MCCLGSSKKAQASCQSSLKPMPDIRPRLFLFFDVISHCIFSYWAPLIYPQVEGYKYDPEGEYVRRWLPELSRLPTEWVHHPWDAPSNVLRAAGVELGSNYPRPIVDIEAARERLAASLGAMWASEAALKAGGLEEGLGETPAVGAGRDSSVGLGCAGAFAFPVSEAS